MDKKNVMYDAPMVGDRIIARGHYAQVTDIIQYPPNAHPDSPLRNDLFATEYVTERGSRWLGSLQYVGPRDPSLALLSGKAE